MSPGLKLACHLLLTLVFPIPLVGVINRVKARWAGRRGAPYLQLAFDLARLAKKTPVYSETSSWVFPLSALAALAATLLASALTPVIPGYAPASFPYDFLAFAGVLAAGRFCLLLGGLDTGSAFGGMGCARTATAAALVEPGFLILIGALVLTSGMNTFDLALAPNESSWGVQAVRALAALLLFLLLQFETARAPIDDPTTHLELTMLHEAVILDHSGPELAFLQYTAALELTLFVALIARLVSPFGPGSNPLAATAAAVAIMTGLAVVIGLVESLLPRLRLRTLPGYAATLGLLATILLVSILTLRGGLT